MPTIAKQHPRPAVDGTPARIKGKAGSVLSEAVPIEELPDSWIKLLVYGNNGVGKTTLACTFPKPLLLVSFEPAVTGGARSVRRVPGISYIKVTETAKERQLVEELRGELPFKTVVVDSVTSYQDMKLQEIIGAPLPELKVLGQSVCVGDVVIAGYDYV